MMHREIKAIHCSCGGQAKQQTPTEEEEKEYGCKRRKDCCVNAWECDKCKTRWTIALEPPDHY